MKNLIFVGLFCALTSLSCSDFSNSPASDSEGQDKYVETGNNPFPPGYEKPNSAPFTEAKMLVNIGVNVIAKGVSDFRLQAELFKNSVESYCESLSGTTPELELARSQWKKAMLAFHFVDGAPVGPLSDQDLGLGANIYSHPYLNTCGIDRQLALGTYKNPESLAFNMRGLKALEYLLFDDKLGSTCHKAAYPETHEWAKKPQAEKLQDRCDMAKSLSADLLESAKKLESLWDVDRGNYTANLINGKLYSKVHDATNAVSDALFSIEEIKDDKLAKPLGLHKDCLNDSGICPEYAEHSYSGLALQAQESQIKGFLAVFFGSSQPSSTAYGFDDLLANKKHKDVAEKIRTKAEAVLASLQPLKSQGSLQTQIKQMDPAKCKTTTTKNRLEPLCAYYQDLRELTSTLKTEVLLALSLRAPPVFEGDND